MLVARPDPATVGRIADRLDPLEDEPFQLALSLVLDHGGAVQAPIIRRLFLERGGPRPEQTVRALARWAGDRAVPELASLLGGDPERNDVVWARLRETLARAPDLDRSGLEAAVDRVLGDPDRRARRGAVRAAAELGLALPPIEERLDDPDASVRAAAADACRILSLRGASARLQGRADDDDPDVRATVFAALLALRPERREALARRAAAEDCVWVRRRMEAALDRSR
jgi:HEAT repeat protein